MYTYIWEYHVGEEQVPEFLRHYGPNGTWVALFQRAEGYLGTALCRDRDRRDRFVTIDTWRSAAAHEAFRQAFAAEFDEIDRHCETLTERERFLGSFDYIDPAS